MVLINDDQHRALEHEAAEEERAWPCLQRLGNMQSASVTVADLRTLLELDVYTYPNRMQVKRLYEQYIGETDWAPQREPRD